jgi:hypothetical protein
MSGIETLLGRLQKVRGKNGSWVACCPAHEDKSPSLSIRDSGGKILLHCFGGCDVHTILGAVGMEISELFPPDEVIRNYDEQKPAIKPRLYATDLLRIIQFESLVVSVAAYDLSQGKRLSEQDRARLMQAHQRITEATEFINA